MKNDPKSGKSRRVRVEGSGPKIKKSTIQNAGNLEMKGGVWILSFKYKLVLG